ncbi:type II toxin-antitoxin system RelE/ParE family toxin [Chlorogloeopsis fritschii PCC 9212]|uniref:Toxin n=1 Tax=Chlorogloeopsis fritschii PCC 6912 TaxID=211165 RepID=A0A3S0Y896_CHLFR|nr:type II toxin-antitoxin system RelE/ParE family toxin [Chlorogloeopsis fritschii]MBF2008653.1 type II toxin-antitoxin system RelE/ParE family toxin [Chlorogloeopsis fritschii C42_A2020_084]RUR78790.1 plasmid stabilization protein [Chlorogloeopsis fritschii PCC 6912]
MPIILKKPLAEADLLEIWNFIANDSFEKADRFLQKIENQLKILASNPGMGRRRDSLVPNLRSFPVGNYLIFYSSINQGIEVIRVLHGARDIQSLFEDSEDDE